LLVGPSGAGKSRRCACCRTRASRLGPGRRSEDACARRPRRRAGVSGATSRTLSEYALFPHLTARQRGLRFWRAPARAATRNAAPPARGWNGSGSPRWRRRVPCALGRRAPARRARASARLEAERGAARRAVRRARRKPVRLRVRDELQATLATLDVPVVLVTHDESDAVAFGSPIVRLERGRVAESPRM